MNRSRCCTITRSLELISCSSRSGAKTTWSAANSRPAEYRLEPLLMDWIQGSSISGSLKMPIQTLQRSLPTLCQLCDAAGTKTAVFYCGKWLFWGAVHDFYADVSYFKVKNIAWTRTKGCEPFRRRNTKPPWKEQHQKCGFDGWLQWVVDGRGSLR